MSKSINKSDPGAAELLEALTARLLLQLQQLDTSATVGEPPHEEELVAMLEGRLGATRREQIISFLVRDNSLYQDWIQLVEAWPDLSPETAPETPPESATQSVTSRWWHRLVSPSFGLSATVAAIVAAVVLQPWQFFTTPPSAVDQLYNDWSDSTQPAPASAAGYRASGAAPVAETSKAIAAGVLAGLDKLGPEYDIPNLPRSLLIESAAREPDQASPLFALGQVLALTYFQCRNTERAAYETALQPVLQELTMEVLGIPGMKLSNLEKRDEQPLCVWTQRTLTEISRN